MAIDTGKTNSFKDALESNGIPAIYHDTIVSSIITADMELADATAHTPVEVINTQAAATSLLGGVPTMRLVEVETVGGKNYAYFERRDPATGSVTQLPAVPEGPAGPTGPAGADGAAGANGADGADGAAGPGVASGGTAGQYLKKNSGTDYDTVWSDFPTTIAGYGITDAVTLSGAQTITGTKTFQPATDTNAIIAKTASGGSTATKIIVGQDSSGTECFSVTGAGNVVFTNSGTMRYAVLNHPSTPDLYFGTNSRALFRGAVYGGGAGNAIYNLNSMSASATVETAYFHEDTPAQITADQNNYALTAGATLVRLSSDAARNITGIVPPSLNGASKGGLEVTLVNVGSFTITLKNESASSTAANRFIGGGGADTLIVAGGLVRMVYDNTSARWRVG